MAVPKVLNTETLACSSLPSASASANAAHDHHVDVGRGAAQEVIAHIAADDESPHALLVGQARNSPEYGIRQRHAATSRVA